MIITKNLTIGGKKFTKKYSDKNAYIENESGNQYSEIKVSRRSLSKIPRSNSC